MPEFHAEPFLTLAALTHKSALISWGAFFFKVKAKSGSAKLVDDNALSQIFPPRRQTIGARSEPYGDARVEVLDGNGKLVAAGATSTTNHCWITSLEPDTEYSYRVIVNGQEWGEEQRRDWSIGKDDQGLQQLGGRYVNRFRTLPDPTRPAAPFSFAVIGDFGTGVKKLSSNTKRQREVAAALERAVLNHDVRLILTTGDNIYARTFLGIPVGSQGDEDDDWFFTYYQPYRYIINRIPVYPSIGNHDTDESEEQDDRGQLFDNMYLDERLAGEEAAGRASVGPGLFYRFRYGSDVEFVCIDTSKDAAFAQGRMFEHPKHQEFLKAAFPEARPGEARPKWKIPFSHHPPFSAGPRHRNTGGMDKLLPLFAQSGVRAVFSGHEHNFQHSRFDGIDYFISGGGGKVRPERPGHFVEAHTQSWCSACHFLLVRIDGETMTVRAVAEQSAPGAELSEIVRLNPSGIAVTQPMVVRHV